MLQQLFTTSYKVVHTLGCSRYQFISVRTDILPKNDKKTNGKTE